MVEHGTGTAAAISGVDVAGKTGTTSDYGDAWFVGWTPQITTAVWVGFPNKLVPMTTLFNGGPVEGGTFPAEIWHTFMVQALQIYSSEAAEFGPHNKAESSSSTTTSIGTAPSTVSPGSTVPQTSSAPSATGWPGPEPPRAAARPRRAAARPVAELAVAPPAPRAAGPAAPPVAELAVAPAAAATAVAPVAGPAARPVAEPAVAPAAAAWRRRTRRGLTPRSA